MASSTTARAAATSRRRCSWSFATSSQGLGSKPLLRAHDGFPERLRLAPARTPLLAVGHPQHHALPPGAYEATLERHAIARETAVGVHRLPEPAEPDQLVGVELGRRRLRHRRRHPAGQRGQREHVVAVVLEHPRKLAGPPSPKEVEVHARDQSAGEVVGAAEAEHVLLERPEPAVARAERSRARRAGVRRSRWKRSPGQRRRAEHEARLQQRQVEARSVVGDEAVEVSEQGLERGEQRGLLVEVAHEVLPNLEAVAVEEAGPDEERVGTGAARQARWSRCRGRGAACRRAPRRPPARAIARAGCVDLPGARERGLAVAMVEPEAPPDDEHRRRAPSPRRRRRAAPRARRGARSAAERVLGLDPPDDLMELGASSGSRSPLRDQPPEQRQRHGLGAAARPRSRAPRRTGSRSGSGTPGWSRARARGARAGPGRCRSASPMPPGWLS